MNRAFIHILPLLFCWTTGTAQDTLNNTGPDGKPIGYWIHWGKDQPEKGYPPDGKISEGRYISGGRKEGKWIMYHEDGKTPKTLGNFHENRPQGPYQKINPEGWVEQEGTYGGGKQTGSFKVMNKEGVVIQEKTFNTDGQEDGDIIYRYPNGQIEMQVTKVDGQETTPVTYYYENGDVKRIVTKNADGTTNTEERAMVNPPVTIQDEPEPDSGPAPDGSRGDTNGPKFNPSGYNKVYNDNKELWLDGEFQNGKLWNGKQYKYDSDGILLKIEIWKEGKYHSDGQL